MQTIQEETTAEPSNVDYSDTYRATIQRQRNTDSWGIRVHGGTDWNEPITVHQVRRKSPASKAGVKEGDLVSYINNQPTDGMSHQQIADIFSSEILTLELILTRQIPVSLRTGHDDVTERNRHNESLAERSNNVLPPTDGHLASLTLDSSKRKAVFNLAHQVHLPQPVKSYQPFDFLNAPTASRTSSSTSPRQVYQVMTIMCPRQVSATGQHITDWQQTPTVTSPDSDSGFSQPSPQIIPPADPSRDQPIRTYQRTKPSRVIYDDDIGLIETGGAFGPPRQSKSFMLIATALSVQGAGETGLPPPRSAIFEHVRALESQNQLQAEWL